MRWIANLFIGWGREGGDIGEENHRRLICDQRRLVAEICFCSLLLSQCANCQCFALLCTHQSPPSGRHAGCGGLPPRGWHPRRPTRAPRSVREAANSPYRGVWICAAFHKTLFNPLLTNLSSCFSYLCTANISSKTFLNLFDVFPLTKKTPFQMWRSH